MREFPSALQLSSLTQRFAEHFEVGCAVNGRLPESLSEIERALLTHHFNGLTPENGMKPQPVHPEPDRYDFAAADALVDFAETHRMNVTGHTLVWHQQCPEWFFQSASRSVLLDRLERHIHTVVGRYRGKVRGWDVVNEAIADDDGLLRPTPWLAQIGEDYLSWAFRFAKEADPNALLYYNDYNLERPTKRRKALRLLRQLQSENVPIDGVGIQGHWVLDQVPHDDIAEAISSYADLGLAVMFTELDVDVVERPDCGADLDVQRAYSLREDPYAAGCPQHILDRQAQAYARLFELFTSRPAVTRVTFWGLHDGRSWLNHWPGKRTNHPLLFDRHCRPKPAVKRILELPLRPASTAQASIEPNVPESATDQTRVARSLNS